MRIPLASLAAVLALATVPGCFFYTGDDDGGDECMYGTSSGGDSTSPGAAIYDPGSRDPATGQCHYFLGGGGGTCSDPCAPCPANFEGQRDQAAVPVPTWGACESACTGLDEETCIETAACRAIYNGDLSLPDELVYAECWAVDTTGPIQGGGCEELDAYACSVHDDCSAVHGDGVINFGEPDGDEAGGAEAPQPTVGYFEACIPEKTECELQGTNCPAPEVGVCEGEVTCEMVEPACPTGTTAGISGDCYSGYCIPLADCGDGDPDPGLCYGSITGDEPAPLCPDGTIAGTANGYYTGYCIPMNACEAVPACGDLSTESQCVSQADCSPIYEGIDCACTEDECTCADWVYDHCE